MTQLADIRVPAPAGSARPGRTRRAERALAALGTRRDFLLLWCGQTVSKIGNGAYKTALAWSVYQISGSTADMGAVLALNLIPELLLALFGGAVADRLPRRAVVVAADAVAATVTLGLALAASAGLSSVRLLMAAALLLGVVSAFYGPAYAALRRDLVATGGVRATNAWLGVSGNLARMAGPALAGVLFAAGGGAGVFGADAATFAFAVVTTLFIRTRPTADPVTTPVTGPAAQAPSIVREMVEGLAYTVKTGWMVLVLALSLVANLACLAPYAVLLPAAVAERGGDIGLLGALGTTEIAVGIAAALAIGRLGRHLRPGFAMLALCATLGAGSLLLGLSRGAQFFLFAGVSLIGVGLSFDVIEQTLLQALVPQRLMSRVYAVNTVVSYSLLPAGYAASGLVARHIGALPILAGGGIALMVCCAAAAALPAVRRLNEADC